MSCPIRARIVLSLVLSFAACAGDDGSGDAGDGAPPPVAFAPPKNPHLADSTWPIFHRDSYAQHSSELRGVEAKDGPPTVTIVPVQGIPIFTLFDQHGDILTVTKSLQGAWLFKIDRETLTEVARVELAAGGDTFAGAYGYIDAEGRAVVGLGRKISRYVADADSLDLEASIDVSPALQENELMVAITVLYSGEIAFAGDRGTIGVVAGDLTGEPLDTHVIPGAEISNGITTDEDGGIYVVDSTGLRRIDWSGAALEPRWESPIDAPFTEPRPGRLGIGSGTTPALMMDDMVAIADDAESMNLVVVRRAVDTAGAPREVCKLPVFDGEAATDNAIVVAGRTMIIAQNLSGLTGVARFDLDAETGTCTRAWAVPASAPTCVPTLSTASGLVYVYSDNDGIWGLTGLDLATGEERFFAEAGQGGQYNNYYAAVTIGPDSRVYIGTLAGLVVFSD